MFQKVAAEKCAAICADIEAPFEVKGDHVDFPNIDTYFLEGKGMVKFDIICTSDAQLQFSTEVIAPSGHDDSFIVQFDNGKKDTWHVPNTATWDFRGWGKRYDAKKGQTHSFKLLGREDGISIKTVSFTSSKDGCKFVSPCCSSDEAESSDGGAESSEIEIVSSTEGSWVKATSHICQYHGYKPISSKFKCMQAVEAGTKKDGLPSYDNYHNGPTGCRRDGQMNNNNKVFYSFEEENNVHRCTKGKECYCDNVPASKEVNEIVVALFDQELACVRVLEDYLYDTTSKSTGPEKCDCYNKYIGSEKMREYGLNKYCEVTCENCSDGCIHKGTCYSRRTYDATEFACIATEGKWCSANASTGTMSFMVASVLNNPIISISGILGFSVAVYAILNKIFQQKQYDTIL